MEKLAEYLVDKKGLKKIACFYKNDAYGQTGLNGIRLALEKRSLELVATGSYERNTLAVKSALLDIRKAKPDAVVMAGTYQPCAEFIRTAGKIGMKDTVFCNMSFVGTDALLKEVGDAGEGCVISQVVSFPWDDSVALVKEYHDALKSYAPDSEPGFVSLEGYMTAKLFCMILGGLKDITRENFIREIETVKTFDMGGIAAQFGTSDHQGMDSVFLTVIKDGVIKPLND
jgi:ABC-type branched-subunit amino acid transport system substrate-binding protein